MGLGQIICLKQYVRGGLFALVEIVFILSIIVGSQKIIPTDKAGDEYLNGTPDTATLYEYLEEAGWAGLDAAKQKRADAMKKFFTDKGPAAVGLIAFNDEMDLVDDDTKNDKAALAEATAEAKQVQADAISEAKETFADYDYTNLDDVDSASGDIAGDEKTYDEFLKLSTKFDAPLNKAMAKMEAKKFADNKSSRLPTYKAAIAKAKSDYKAAQANTDKENKQILADLSAAYKADMQNIDKIAKDLHAQGNSSDVDIVGSLFPNLSTDEVTAYINRIEGKYKGDYKSYILKDTEKDARRQRTNDYNMDVDAANIAWTDAKDNDRFAYEDDLKAAFADFGGDNEFDENYDGCDICKKATAAGKRTLRHRAWFRGPLVSSLHGLTTLGVKQNTSEANYKDHSIFMMINGLMALVLVGFYIFLYQLSIGNTKVAIKKIIWNGRFPTMKEAQNDISQNSFATIGIAPSVVMIAIFALIPLLFSALVAFTNYSSPDHIPPNNLVGWVGLENFATMFSTNVGNGEWAKAFGSTAVWTLVWAVFATFTCFFCGFFYAFVLQDKRIPIPTFFRTVYILPYAIPTMLSLFVWANLLNGTIGPINRTLQLLGIIDKSVPFLSDPWVAKGSLIFVNIWIGFPYAMILTTSSMTAISASLYEAATIDGATKWDQFKSITYPLVMFQLKPTLIMQFAGNINNFGAVFFLTGGGPNMPQPGLTTATNCGATDLLISWIYKLTMNTPQRYHLASVLSLLVFAVLVPFALYNFSRATKSQEGGF